MKIKDILTESKITDSQNKTIERATIRAIELAKADGTEINDKNAEGYLMAGLAAEMKMIEKMLNTTKGKKVAMMVADRVYKDLKR